MINVDFYINDVKVLDWLNNDENQTIRFKDRIEYKENNELSRKDGPAIEYFSPTKDNLFYLNGKKLTIDEFKIINKLEKINQI